MKKAMSGNILTFTFDGGLPAVICDTTKVSAEIKHYAMLDRIMSSIGDTAAIPKLQPNGTVIMVTEAMRRAKVAERAAYLESGTTAWTVRAAKASVQNPIWLAMATKRGVSYDVVAAEHAQADLDALAAL